MGDIWLANYQSIAGADAENDDGTDMYDGAEPVGVVLMDIKEETVHRVLDLAWTDEVQAFEEALDEKEAKGEWTRDWLESDRQRWVWRSTPDSEPEVCVVIRKAHVI